MDLNLIILQDRIVTSIRFSDKQKDLKCLQYSSVLPATIRLGKADKTPVQLVPQKCLTMNNLHCFTKEAN